jgi:predicted DNA-binding protein with PD1-like motif
MLFDYFAFFAAGFFAAGLAAGFFSAVFLAAGFFATGIQTTPLSCDLLLLLSAYIGRNIMLVERKPIENLIFIRLNPNDDVLASLNEAVAKNEIKNAIIITGFGSVRTHHYHVVGSRENPPVNLFAKEDKASDVVTISGCIINGRVHAHITHSDKDIAFGGHLEPGVQVLTFLSVILAEVDYDLSHFDSIGKIEELRASI